MSHINPPHSNVPKQGLREIFMAQNRCFSSPFCFVKENTLQHKLKNSVYDVGSEFSGPVRSRDRCSRRLGPSWATALMQHFPSAERPHSKSSFYCSSALSLAVERLGHGFGLLDPSFACPLSCVNIVGWTKLGGRVQVRLRRLFN